MHQTHCDADLKTFIPFSICILLLWETHQTRENIWENKATFLPLVTLEQTFIAEKFHQGKEEINMASYKKKKEEGQEENV